MAGGEGSSAEGIIHCRGGHAAAGFQGYKPITDEALIAAAPDLILMMDREGDLAIDNADVLAHLRWRKPCRQIRVRSCGLTACCCWAFGPRTPEAA